MNIKSCDNRSIRSPCTLQGRNYQVDPYIGCEHYCYYCYALNQAETDWNKEVLIHEDIGIGTGLASRSFAKLGLKVYGCDGSAEMLKVCESKAFATDLKAFDLQDIPLPYSDSFFDHVICCSALLSRATQA